MNIRNLRFFDSLGYDLNFKWNIFRDCWEGNIYLPKVSVGLYANTSIYVLEEFEEKVKNEKGEDEIVYNLYHPMASSDNKEKLSLSWDILNKFVDEFFIFTFDTSEINPDTSALSFKYNDGPEIKKKNGKFCITRFDTYDVILENELKKTAIPIHVAFSASSNHDANTYKRTLIIEYNFKQIARINFYAETVEEDERLKVLTRNMGYNIEPKDELIFKTSDIKECKPDYQLLNEKRKEIMIEGSNIYPYIGSYKSLFNIIKFFGYNNLNIVEFWQNIDPSDENFGYIYHVDKYTLTDNEAVYIDNQKITIPSSTYKKTNRIGLSYKMNTTYNKYDLFELPKTKEEFDYTIEEALIKLYALKEKINESFLPAGRLICDVTGTANYFGICGLDSNIKTGSYMSKSYGEDLDIEVYPKDIRITKNKLFKDFIREKYVDTWNDDPFAFEQIFGNIVSKSSESDSLEYESNSYEVDDLFNNKETGHKLKDYPIGDYIKTQKQLCDDYKMFHKILTEEFGIEDDIVDDFFDYFEYDDSKLYTNTDTILRDKISAKVILTNTSFEQKTFGNTFDSFYSIPKELTFKNADYYEYNHISWTVRYSSKDNQIDEDLLTVGELKTYYPDIDYVKNVECGNTIINEDGTFSWTDTKEGYPKDLESVFFELPFVGYYDVQLTITDSTNFTTSKHFSKHIKVEPYHLDIRGFYYDNREIPIDNFKHTQYYQYLQDIDVSKYTFTLPEEKYRIDYDDYYKSMTDFISNRIKMMVNIAASQKSSYSNDDKNMVIFGNEYETYKYNNKEYIKYYIKKNDYTSGNFNIFSPSPYEKGKYLRKSFVNNVIVSNVWTSGDEIFGYPHIIKVNVVNEGPYSKWNTNSEILSQDNIDNNNLITYLVPNTKTARYIKDGVDIKPYTWILLGFENSKIVGKYNPKWELIDIETNKVIDTQYDDFFAYLFRLEGNYRIKLSIKDINGNSYEVYRNLIVVDINANYNLYTLFKKDYDEYIKDREARLQTQLEITSKLLDDSEIFGDWDGEDENEEITS